MDGGDVGDPFDIGELWSDGEGAEDGPRPTHDGGMDTMSMEQLGLKAQDVPADGNCLLHAFAQAQRRTSHAAKATPTQVLREQLAKFVESRKEAIGRLHARRNITKRAREHANRLTARVHRRLMRCDSHEQHLSADKSEAKN